MKRPQGVFSFILREKEAFLLPRMSCVYFLFLGSVDHLLTKRLDFVQDINRVVQDVALQMGIAHRSLDI